MGRSHFWFVVKKLEEPEEGTDRWAVERGYVSMTPLRLDLTNEEQLEIAKQRMPMPIENEIDPASTAAMRVR
jgi:5'-nucleotidase